MIGLLALLAVSVGGQTYAPGFDCTKSTTEIEKTICASEELSRLDELLGRFYVAALDVLNQSPCLKSDQRAWLLGTRNRCQDVACLRRAYLDRLGALIALQPGMNIPNDLELPATPRLRWIVPRVDDPFMTPKLDSRPYEGSGTIGYVLDKGGYVLQTADGVAHTLIPDIAIDGGSAVHLGVLKDQKAAVSVRGRHAIVNRTEQMFDNRYCIAIYERP